MNDNGGERQTLAFFAGADRTKLNRVGRALVNVLDALYPEPDTNEGDRAGQLMAATILQKAVYARFGITSVAVTPLDVPDRPPSE